MMLCSNSASIFYRWLPGDAQKPQSLSAMESTSQSVKGNASGDDIFRRLSIDLNHLPVEEETMDVTEPPRDDLPPPPPFFVELCFHNEDIAVLKQKYKVLGDSSVAESNGFENLGFHGGRSNFAVIRDDRPKDVDSMESLLFPEPLCASMVEVRKEGEKDSTENKENDEDEDGLAAKDLLRDFINQAKARRIDAARKKGKNIQKQVRFASGPRSQAMKK